MKAAESVCDGGMSAINPENRLQRGESDEAVVLIAWPVRIVMDEEILPISSERVLISNDFSFSGEAYAVSFPDEGESGFRIQGDVPDLC